ncbi:MAG: aldehyde dehydrogenase family protein [Caldilineaceae bacterium]|nr:aldehyde dehydrogenase family protein [Caldilineaceae bacterium]MBP8106253.1 aldehyde dehydrogenase family protein [Caldilineaceae bacterium]MBP8121184.1 aldehyde dehydrogenase family protein [Caldilineaceae bacterium]MBP9071577.1 aldehyde dehydrogenase family protein [Caldilineaceae bacterium]
MAQKFKITYATMSADNEELQSAFDQALASVEANLGVEVPMFIDGERVYSSEKMNSYSPIDTDMLLCVAQKGTLDHAKAAIAAAKKAAPIWAATPWQERVAIMRRIADNISDNIFELSAIMVLEVGKSRLEAMGEVEETADLLRYYAQSMEDNGGFLRRLGKLDPKDETENNFSVLRPFGVWAVISPFNFPMALSGAPIAAALVTGNTVVFKGASTTLFNGWKTAELFADAGLPAGVFNYVSGPGRSVGQELLDNPAIAGWTFTGSYEIGMKVAMQGLTGPYPRPTIIEMGGKNPAIVSRTADLDIAALGSARSAFGLDGQKCSACSRLYVEDAVYDEFMAKLIAKTESLKVADPRSRDAYMGTVIDKAAYEDFQRFVAKAREDGTVLTGGNVLTEGDFAKGYFVEPTIITDLPEDHELVKGELFLPILYVGRVKNLDEAMAKANDTIYGLTAGFFGKDQAEIDWFLDNIQAGTIYTNRPGGATTGAWPGVQAFGGWKGSGSSGKGIGSFYTLALYMHEQSRTIIG